MNSTDLGQRVLLFSSIGHALMHLMTAFYAVIVLTLAIAWELPAEDLLALRCRYAGLLEELRALDDLHRAAGLRCAEAAPLSAAMTCGAATLRAA